MRINTIIDILKMMNIYELDDYGDLILDEDGEFVRNGNYVAPSTPRSQDEINRSQKHYNWDLKKLLIDKPELGQWAQFTYEEILAMERDGVLIPDEVLEWAHEEAQVQGYTNSTIPVDEEMDAILNTIEGTLISDELDTELGFDQNDLSSQDVENVIQDAQTQAEEAESGNVDEDSEKLNQADSIDENPADNLDEDQFKEYELTAEGLIPRVVEAGKKSEQIGEEAIKELEDAEEETKALTLKQEKVAKKFEDESATSSMEEPDTTELDEVNSQLETANTKTLKGVDKLKKFQSINKDYKSFVNDAQKTFNKNSSFGLLSMNGGALMMSTGTFMITTGSALIASGTPLLSNPFTALFGMALVGEGVGLVVSGSMLDASGVMFNVLGIQMMMDSELGDDAVETSLNQIEVSETDINDVIEVINNGGDASKLPGKSPAQKELYEMQSNDVSLLDQALYFSDKSTDEINEINKNENLLTEIEFESLTERTKAEIITKLITLITKKDKEEYDELKEKEQAFEQRKAQAQLDASLADTMNIEQSEEEIYDEEFTKEDKENLDKIQQELEKHGTSGQNKVAESLINVEELDKQLKDPEQAKVGEAAIDYGTIAENLGSQLVERSQGSINPADIAKAVIGSGIMSVGASAQDKGEKYVEVYDKAVAINNTSITSIVNNQSELEEATTVAATITHTATEEASESPEGAESIEDAESAEGSTDSSLETSEMSKEVLATSTTTNEVLQNVDEADKKESSSKSDDSSIDANSINADNAASEGNKAKGLISGIIQETQEQNQETLEKTEEAKRTEQDVERDERILTKEMKKEQKDAEKIVNKMAQYAEELMQLSEESEKLNLENEQANERINQAQSKEPAQNTSGKEQQGGLIAKTNGVITQSNGVVQNETTTIQNNQSRLSQISERVVYINSEISKSQRTLIKTQLKIRKDERKFEKLAKEKQKIQEETLKAEQAKQAKLSKNKSIINVVKTVGSIILSIGSILAQIPVTAIAGYVLLGVGGALMIACATADMVLDSTAGNLANGLITIAMTIAQIVMSVVGAGAVGGAASAAADAAMTAVGSTSSALSTAGSVISAAGSLTQDISNIKNNGYGPSEDAAIAGQILGFIGSITSSAGGLANGAGGDWTDKVKFAGSIVGMAGKITTAGATIAAQEQQKRGKAVNDATNIAGIIGSSLSVAGSALGIAGSIGAGVGNGSSSNLSSADKFNISKEVIKTTGELVSNIANIVALGEQLEGAKNQGDTATIIAIIGQCISTVGAILEMAGQLAEATKNNAESTDTDNTTDIITTDTEDNLNQNDNTNNERTPLDNAKLSSSIITSAGKIVSSIAGIISSIKQLTGDKSTDSEQIIQMIATSLTSVGSIMNKGIDVAEGINENNENETTVTPPENSSDAQNDNQETPTTPDTEDITETNTKNLTLPKGVAAAELTADIINSVADITTMITQMSASIKQMKGEKTGKFEEVMQMITIGLTSAGAAINAGVQITDAIDKADRNTDNNSNAKMQIAMDALNATVQIVTTVTSLATLFTKSQYKKDSNMEEYNALLGQSISVANALTNIADAAMKRAEAVQKFEVDIDSLKEKLGEEAFNSLSESDIENLKQGKELSDDAIETIAKAYDIDIQFSSDMSKQDKLNLCRQLRTAVGVDKQLLELKADPNKYNEIKKLAGSDNDTVIRNYILKYNVMNLNKSYYDVLNSIESARMPLVMFADNLERISNKKSNSNVVSYNMRQGRALQREIRHRMRIHQERASRLLH